MPRPRAWRCSVPFQSPASSRSTSSSLMPVWPAIVALMTPGIAKTANGSWYCVQMVPWVLPLSSSEDDAPPSLASLEGITTVPWV